MHPSQKPYSFGASLQIKVWLKAVKISLRSRAEGKDNKVNRTRAQYQDSREDGFGRRVTA
jgi:hypothetical protein